MTQPPFFELFESFWVMAAAHFLADYSLQSDSMAIGKHPGKHPVPWYWWLTAHAAVHGLAVWFVTRSVTLGTLEWAAHWAVDYAKIRGRTSLNVDQFLHLMCKAVWVLLAALHWWYFRTPLP